MLRKRKLRPELGDMRQDECGTECMSVCTHVRHHVSAGYVGGYIRVPPWTQDWWVQNCWPALPAGPLLRVGDFILPLSPRPMLGPDTRASSRLKKAFTVTDTTGSHQKVCLVWTTSTPADGSRRRLGAADIASRSRMSAPAQ